MLELGQPVAFFLDLRLDVLQFVDGLGVSEEILAVDVGGHPLLLGTASVEGVGVFGVGQGGGVGLIAMGEQGLVVLGLHIGKLGH